MSAHPIRMTGIDKSFGPVRANRGATLDVAPGEIHALVGENGAGKSTLMKILGGLTKPDAGTVEVNGRDVTGWSTSDAIAAGVGVVHQHFMLVPTLTVAENVVLGNEPRRGVMFDRARALSDVTALIQRTGLIVPADRRVAELSVGEAQRVEILKTLYRGAKILILDEPTAVLSPPDVQELWGVLRKLRDDGGTIVLITHRLDEVIDISETITVMRAGATVGRMQTAGTTPAEIAKAMVGRDVVLSAPVREAVGGAAATTEHAIAPLSAPILQVTDLAVNDSRRVRVVDGVSFAIRPGEVLGIAGVEGNGQTELIEAIAGLRDILGGSITVGGRDITSATVKERRDAGIAHVPEDRHRRGLILEYSIAENLVLGAQHEFASRGSLDTARIESHAQQQIAKFDVRPPTPAPAARTLSGGNQQKVVIAREMGRSFTVLLAAQPTRGVDVGAIEFIHRQIREARDAGKAILLVSAELNEVLALADKVAVMYRGKFAVTMPAREATPEVLGPYMTGGGSRDAA
ncbi:MAG TPA: ABC transporter ATP-binding protein [Gemmatimonadaceae bacterium]|nr:ABC transporter ATP-binding protein [Gemmatimonadaceae bacterium]